MLNSGQPHYTNGKEILMSHPIIKLATLLYLFILFFTGCNRQDLSSKESQTAILEPVTPDPAPSAKRILFFGNSLTAGYGVEPEQAFPYLIQQKLDSLGLPYQVINGGLSGETTASGVNRIEWVLREPIEVMILELGGNDGLRGVDPDETTRNLQEIVDLAQKKYPDMQIIIAGMEAPPNMGSEYVSSFRNVFKGVADGNNLPLIPFLLEGVGGEPELNLPDGIHPNPEGHQIVAKNVWKILKQTLSETSK